MPQLLPLRQQQKNKVCFCSFVLFLLSGHTEWGAAARREEEGSGRAAQLLTKRPSEWGHLVNSYMADTHTHTQHTGPEEKCHGCHPAHAVTGFPKAWEPKWYHHVSLPTASSICKQVTRLKGAPHFFPFSGIYWALLLSVSYCNEPLTMGILFLPTCVALSWGKLLECGCL